MDNANNKQLSKDFSRKTVSSLRKKGITIIGARWLPGTDGTYANGATGYELDDNGTSRIRMFLEVLALAA